VNLDQIEVEASYAGPRLDGADQINGEWVQKLMEYQQGQKVLHRKYAMMILLRCREIFEKDQSLVHISVPED
jgi:serine/threonine-protein phosphatase 5